MSSARRARGCLALVALALGAVSARAAPEGAPARRIVSMNPSLTEMLVSLGAAPALVGVDEFSARQQPALRELPTVGGLFNPSLEAVVALQPDLVVLVPSAEQRDFRRRLEELGIAVLALSNITLDEILSSLEALGGRVGRGEAAQARVGAIRSSLRAVASATAGLARPRAVLVLQREPLFIVGGGNFLDRLLEAAGVENAGSGFPEPYPRVDVEWLIGAAPELILDASDDPLAPAQYWSRWPSLPAVAAGRAIPIAQGDVTRPGPYLDRAVRLLARAAHGPGPWAAAQPGESAP